jgi:hypothetical protein
MHLKPSPLTLQQPILPPANGLAGERPYPADFAWLEGPRDHAINCYYHLKVVKSFAKRQDLKS